MNKSGLKVSVLEQFYMNVFHLLKDKDVFFLWLFCALLCLKDGRVLQRHEANSDTLSLTSRSLLYQRDCLGFKQLTLDVKLRKFNVSKTPHLVSLILLAGDIATNPGPSVCLTKTAELNLARLLF